MMPNLNTLALVFQFSRPAKHSLVVSAVTGCLVFVKMSGVTAGPRPLHPTSPNQRLVASD